MGRLVPAGILIALAIALTAVAVSVWPDTEESTTVASSEVSGTIISVKRNLLGGACKVRIEIGEHTVEQKKLKDFCKTVQRGQALTLTKIVRTRVTDGQVLPATYQ